MRLFLQRYSAIELIRQSECWHREIIGCDFPNANAEGPIPTNEWLPLPGLPVSIGDRTVVSLTSHAELQLEGHRLSHCVGNYYQACMYGQSHIVSIRTADHESLSTAELMLADDMHGRPCLTVVQHEAVGGSEPDRQCSDALESALILLRSDALQPQLREIQAFHVEREERMNLFFSLEDCHSCAAQMTEVMATVLPDTTQALAWLENHIDDLEDWCRIQNQKVGEKLRKLGFGDELTEDRAFEIYLTTGIDVYLDESIKIA